MNNHTCTNEFNYAETNKLWLSTKSTSSLSNTDICNLEVEVCKNQAPSKNASISGSAPQTILNSIKGLFQTILLKKWFSNKSLKLTKVVTHSRKMSLCQFGNSKGASIDKSGQGRAGRILTSVLAVFIITWLPYNVLVILQVIAGDTVPDIMWKISYYLWKGLT